ncbi:co-chaperone GroES [candidate division WOR-3 bacterium]|nr:co-chaperone GroES [candidate division WOR-3 bacterium]
MAVKLVPVNRKVIVERTDEQEVKKGGIIIPDTAKEKPQKGKVVSVAQVTKKDEDPMPVKEGDVILFGKYAGTEISVEDKDFLILNEDEILAVIQG